MMEIDAFILIGGRSARFGSDKALLNFGETSLTERTAVTIRKALAPSRITLVAANDRQFANTFGFEDTLPLIFDLYQDRGPFGAVHAALSYAQTEWAVVLACDFPFISTEMLRYLAGLITDDFNAIAPVQPDGRPQPLCAFYRVKPCLKIVERTLIENRRTPPLRTIFEQVRSRLVPFDELKDLCGSENFFVNMNTLEDFQRAARISDVMK